MLASVSWRALAATCVAVGRCAGSLASIACRSDQRLSGIPLGLGTVSSAWARMSAITLSARNGGRSQTIS